MAIFFPTLKYASYDVSSKIKKNTSCSCRTVFYYTSSLSIALNNESFRETIVLLYHCIFMEMTVYFEIQGSEVIG